MRRTRRKPQVQLGNADKWFVIGLASAVAILIRGGYMTQAEEIWRTVGYDFVPTCIEEFDAKPIRKAIRTKWV